MSDKTKHRVFKNADVISEATPESEGYALLQDHTSPYVGGLVTFSEEELTAIGFGRPDDDAPDKMAIVVSQSFKGSGTEVVFLTTKTIKAILVMCGLSDAALLSEKVEQVCGRVDALEDEDDDGNGGAPAEQLYTGTQYLGLEPRAA